MVGGRELQYLDVIGINELANAFVRLVSNLSARVLNLRKKNFAQMKPLEGLLILSRQNKSHGNIYKKAKWWRQIYDGLGSRECQLMQGRLSV